LSNDPKTPTIGVINADPEIKRHESSNACCHSLGRRSAPQKGLNRFR
jgi:hypothetical protein